MKTKNVTVSISFIFANKLFFIMFISIFLSACSGSSNDKSDTNIDPVLIPPTSLSTVAQLREDALNLITGNIYYLDALNGDDTKSGLSEDSAWLTLSMAQSMAQPGDGVMLLSGNYGDYVEDYDNNEDWCHRIQEGLPCNTNDEPSEKKWTVYINKEGSKPVFTRIRLHYPSPEEGPKYSEYPLSTDSYLVFFGIEAVPETGNSGQISEAWLNKVRSDADIATSTMDENTWNDGTLNTYGDEFSAWQDWVAANIDISDPNYPTDPYYPRSEENTYEMTDNPVDIWRANYVSIYNSYIHGNDKHLTKYGTDINNSNHVWLERNEISTCWTTVKYSNNTNLTVRYNNLHQVVSSGIGDGGGNGLRLFEGNHVHDGNSTFGTLANNYTDGGPYVPRALNKNYHGSAMSIRSGNITLRGNIFHDGAGWGSSGIMLYGQSSTGATYYDNVLIENNLIYDMSTSALILQTLGKNVVVRNNTILAFLREDSNYQINKYYITLNVKSLADVDGNGNPYPAGTPRLSMYNNVFGGQVSYDVSFLNDDGIINFDENNNIYWSVYRGGGHGWMEEENLTSNSKLITWWGVDVDSTEDYFTNGFFNEEAYPELFTSNHHQLLDLTLNENSDAINFGDVTNQSADSLGNLDENGEFIDQIGKSRNTENHSAGCYEY